MKKLLDAHAKTAEERQALSERLESEALERRSIEKTKGILLGKLQAMEAKLIQARKKNTHTRVEKEVRKGFRLRACFFFFFQVISRAGLTSLGSGRARVRADPNRTVRF